MKFQERELEIYNGNTEEWEEAQMRYGELKWNLPRKRSSGIGFGELRENLIDWGEDRRIRQKSQESRQGDIIRTYQPFWKKRRGIGDFGKGVEFGRSRSGSG